jgi:excisionase family DNA binding protein
MHATSDLEARSDHGDVGYGLVAVASIANQLGVEERFVRRLVAERRIPYIKVGRYVRFDPRAIRSWVQEHRVEPVSRCTS